MLRRRSRRSPSMMIPSSSFNKVLRSHLELTQVQLEIACRIAEKERESKSKAKALHMKEKVEGNVADLGIAFEHANAGSIETQDSIKKYVIQIRDGKANLGEESRQKCYAQEEED